MFWGLFKETFLKKEYMKVIAFILVWMMTINAAIIIVDPGSLASYATAAPARYVAFDGSTYDQTTYDPDFSWYTGASDGTGTEENPYIIQTGSQLAALAQIVNGTVRPSLGIEKDSFAGKYINISPSAVDANGIPSLDLIKSGGLIYETSDTAQGYVYEVRDATGNPKKIKMQICSDRSGGYGWVPIGSEENTPFEGTISSQVDVNIYNLSALVRVNDAGADSVPSVGLFGFLASSAAIRGINLKDVALYSFNEDTEAMGALAGVADPCADISNCTVEGLPGGTRSTSGGYTSFGGVEFDDYTVPYLNMYLHGNSVNSGGQGGLGGLVGKFRQVRPMPEGEPLGVQSLMSMSLDNEALPDGDETASDGDEVATDGDISDVPEPSEENAGSQPEPSPAPVADNQTATEPDADSASDANQQTTDTAPADSHSSDSQSSDTQESTSDAPTGFNIIKSMAGDIVSRLFGVLIPKVYADTTESAVEQNLPQQNSPEEGSSQPVPLMRSSVSEVSGEALSSGEELTVSGEALMLEGGEVMPLMAAAVAEPITHSCTKTGLSNISVSGIRMKALGTPIGGIIGSFDTSASGNGFENMYFNGEIISIGSTSGTGGIVGRLTAGETTIENAHIAGLSDSVASAAAIYLNGACGGGIVGYASSGTVNVSECTAAVRFLNSDGSFCKLGGIIGDAGGNALNASQCNTTVTAIGTLLAGNDINKGGIGGVAGISRGLTAIDSCNTQIKTFVYLSGSRNAFIGGILGREEKGNGAVTITSCSSINGEVKRIDGIVNKEKNEIICVGGVIGGFSADMSDNYYYSSKIENCHVDNWEVSCDGMVGGILGMGSSRHQKMVSSIKDCTVSNFHVRNSMLYTGDSGAASYLISGGIAPAFNGTIQSCSVTGSSLNLAAKSRNGGYLYLGGITGKLYGGSIEGCLADMNMNIAYKQGTVKRPFMAGGISGTVDVGNITSCAAILQFDSVESIQSFETYAFYFGNGGTSGFTGLTVTASGGGEVLSVDSIVESEYFVGGLAGQLNSDSAKKTIISDSFSTGHINVSDVTLANASGGLVGYINDKMNVTMSNVFSTTSISSEGAKDALGGLVGASFSPNLTINNAWFGGTLLQPWAGAVLGMSRTYTMENVYVNNILAPQRAVASLGPGAKGDGSVQNSKDIPTSIQEVYTSDTGIFKAYYDAAVEPFFDITDAEGTVASSHAFSLASGASLTYNDAASMSLMAMPLMASPQAAPVSEPETENEQAIVSEGGFEAENEREAEAETISEPESTTQEALEQEPITVMGVDSDSLMNILLAQDIGDELDMPALFSLSMETGGMTDTTYETIVTKPGITIHRTVRTIPRLAGHDSENGTEEQPYVFTSSGAGILDSGFSQHVLIGGGHTGSYFELGENCNATFSEADQVGSLEFPFLGTFDGKGHALTLGPGSTGFFGVLCFANIKNVDLAYDGAGVNAEPTLFGNVLAVGGLADHAFLSNIENVHVYSTGGALSGGSAYTGGLIGSGMSTSIQYSSFTGDIATVNSKGTGGIMGIYGVAKINILRFKIDLDTKTGTVLDFCTEDTPTVKSYAAGDIGHKAAAVESTTDGSITAKNGSTAVGGILGYGAGLGETLVSECFMLGNTYGYEKTGGLVGNLKNGNVANSYMRGNVHAVDYAGGILGYAQSSSIQIINAYFAGQINSYGNIGAACGNGATMSNFFFDSQLAGNIPTLGNEPDNRIGSVPGKQLDANPLFGEAVTIGDGEDLNITHSPILDIAVFENISTMAAFTSVILDNYGSRISLNRDYDEDNGGGSSNIFYKDPGNGSGSALNIRLGATVEPAATIIFTGTEFTLIDRPTGKSVPFRVSIDGNDLNPDDLIGVTTTGDISTVNQQLYSGTLQGPNGEWTVTGTAESETADAWSANSDTQTPHNSFSVSGLSNATHTVVITAENNGGSGNRYFTFYGFSFKGQSVVPVLDGKYPQLPAMMASFSAISQLSATRLYDFGEDIKNNAYHIRKNGSLEALATAPGLSYEEQNICPTSGSAIGDFLTVTSDGDKKVYTNVNNEGGGFDAVETWNTDALKGYNLSIKTQIRVVPFEGEGTLEEPFEIPDVKTLVKFRNFINRTFSGRGQYYALTMTPTSEHNKQGYIYDLSDTASGQISQPDSESWSPIGTASSPFAGYFLGKNKQISGLNLTSMSTYTRRGVMEGVAGLFGYVRGGGIQDLIVSGTANVTIPKVIGGAGLRYAYGGMLAAVAENERISNIAVTGESVTFSLEKNDKDRPNAIRSMGGMVGYGRNTAIEDAYVNINSYNISTDTTATGQYGYAYTGGIVGQLRAEMGEASSVERALAYTNLNQDFGAKIDNVAVGGIVGNLYGKGTAADRANVVVGYSGAYGLMDINGRANAGAIVGSYASSGTVSASVNHCTSTMDIYNDTTENNSTLGGIMGGSSSMSISNCMYGGVIHANPAISLTNISGVAKGASFTADDDVFFDASKNFDIADGGSNTGDCCRTTTQLSDGVRTSYFYDRYLKWTTNTPKFLSEAAVALGTSGSAVISKQAEQILKGQNRILYIVRASKVCDTDFASGGPEASSVYVLGEGAEVRLSTPSSFIKTTNDSKRAVSTETNKVTTAQTQAVLVVTGEAVGTTVDAFGGYGKTFRYFPSTRSTGRLDASYIIANPEGDGIENKTPDGSFTIYTADQLMGLGLILESRTLVPGDNSAPDGVGGLINSDIYGNSAAWLSLAGRTVYMGTDISFETSNYPDVNAYKSKVAGTADAPFEGTFDGKNHLISDRVLTAGTNVGLNIGGIFGYVRGQGTDAASMAAVKNVGIVNSLISFAEAGAQAEGLKSVGSLVGAAENAHIENVFSTSRIEQPLVTPQSINMGGIAGTVSGGGVGNRNIIEKAYFTGTIGQTAVLLGGKYLYPGYASGTSELNMGAIAGKNIGYTALSNVYAAAYAAGYNAENIGAVYELTGGGNLTTKNCYFDKNAGAEHCTIVSGIHDMNADTENITLDGYSKPQGMYPVLTAFADRTGAAAAHITASAIPVDFSIAAYSLVRAQVDAGDGATFEKNSYCINTVPMTGSLYNISSEGLQLDRVDNGLGMVKLTYTGNGSVASRTVGFYMQCWYDNYTTQEGIDGTVEKVYTICDREEMDELAQLVMYGDAAEHIGHNHIMHNGTEAEDATFVNAVIKLGNEIVYDAADQTQEPVISVGSDDKPFLGKFDGCGYGFANPTFTSESGLGIFGTIGTSGSAVGTVSNTYVRGDVAISLSENYGSGQRTGIGILVKKSNGGKTENCFNAAAVSLSAVSAEPAVFLGGIVGENINGGEIDGCYNMAHITALNDDMNLGGIAGYNEGDIFNCYNTGILSGFTDKTNVDYVNETVIGGIAAVSNGEDSSVTQCYNAAVLEDYKADMMSPIANITGGGSITDCFMDSQFYTLNFNGVLSGAGITALKTSELTATVPAELSGWLGSGVWDFSGIGYYPMLRAFTSEGAVAATMLAAGASHASALAVLTPDAESFDNFSQITIYKGAYALGDTSANLNIKTDMPDNKIVFVPTTTEGAFTVYDTTEKNGRACIRVTASHDGSIAYRDCLLFGESRYTIRYKIDFSEIIESQGTLRAESTSSDTAAVSFFHSGSTVVTASSLGSGISEDPYIISSIGDMNNLADYVAAGGETENMFFTLVNHLDYTDKSYKPIGTDTQPFNGNFNGNGYTISEIKSMDDNGGYKGIIGHMGSSGSMELLAIKDCIWSAPTSGSSGWAGFFAGRCAGTVSNCYAQDSQISAQTALTEMYVGGIAGETTATGCIQGCYVKNESLVAINTSDGMDGSGRYSGMIVGKNNGTVNGCYASGYMLTNRNVGLLAGWNHGTVENTYFRSSLLDSEYPVWWTDEGKSDVHMSNVSTCSWGNQDFMKTETATEDSAAMLLSQDMYLGTYEMPSSNAVNSGFPVLAGFELVKYDIPSFEGRSNLVVNIKNIDASTSWLLNAMAYFGRFEFPVYAEMSAKQQIYVNLLELPADISFNPSVIAYGTQLIGSGDSQIATKVKASIYNGEYANAGNSNDINAGGGAETHLGAININLSDAGTPMNVTKICVYLKLKNLSEHADTWGVRRSWNSVVMQQFGSNEEIEE